MARIVISGGAGFIGSHLCDKFLSQGHEVLVLDNEVTGRFENIRHLQSNVNFQFMHHDVSKSFDQNPNLKAVLSQSSIDSVLHFASPASPKDFEPLSIEILEVGSAGTRHMAELAVEHDARFMIASTSEVYGDPLVHPQPESYFGNVNTIGARGMYDESKRFSEALTMAFHKRYGLDIRIIRIFNTYGPRMRVDDGRVVSNFLTQAIRQEPITVYGDGLQTRSFCYVDDLVRGVCSLLESSYSLPCNIGNPVEFTMLDLAKEVIRLTGSRSEIHFVPLPADDPMQRKPDLSCAFQNLPWTPEISLSEGLKKTKEYFQRELQKL